MRGLIGYGGLLLAVLLWGGSFPAGHVLAERLSPLVLTTWRFTAAALLMTMLATVRHGRAGRIPGPLRLRVALMGLLGHAAFSMCFFAGLRQTEPAVAAVLSGLEPAAAIVLAAFIGRQRVRPAIWAALGLSAAGTALAAMPTSPVAGGSWMGAGLLMLATVCFGAYTYLGAEAVAAVPPVALTAATMRAAVVPLWLASLLGAPQALWIRPTATEWLALAYIVVGVTMLAFVGWNLGLRTLGLRRAAIWGNGIPVSGLGFSALAGHPPTAWQWVGLSLVLAGIAWVQSIEAGS